MSAVGNKAGLVLLGAGLGMALPSLPTPFSIIQAYVWIILIIVGIILIIKD